MKSHEIQYSPFVGTSGEKWADDTDKGPNASNNQGGYIGFNHFAPLVNFNFANNTKKS